MLLRILLGKIASFKKWMEANNYGILPKPKEKDYEAT